MKLNLKILLLSLLNKLKKRSNKRKNKKRSKKERLWNQPSKRLSNELSRMKLSLRRRPLRQLN